MHGIRAIWAWLCPVMLAWAASPAEAGREQYFRYEFSAAAASFESAIARNSRDSGLYHWLGKTRGRQAERANFLQAPYYARKCRVALEMAVELDGANLLALNDLFSYYLEAPAILGGGLEKAKAAAAKIASLSAAEGHWAAAQLAEKEKNWSEAERNYRRAAEAAPGDAGRQVDVAAFLARRGRHGESEEWFGKAAAREPAHRLLLFEWSKARVQSGRELAKARQMLRKYLESGPTPDEPSRQEAEALLRQAKGS
jgi:tetratricopeptide (TPR) repeat protein